MTNSTPATVDIIVFEPPNHTGAYAFVPAINVSWFLHNRKRKNDLNIHYLEIL